MQHENLWAPWRMTYLRELGRRAHELSQSDPAESEGGSFLADYWTAPDADVDNHVVFRDSAGMILLNRYPYANGHLLVALGEPRPTLLDYDGPQRAAFWRLVDFSAGLMDKALNPQGINIGINQGAAAGAGVVGHLHAHLVPRWNGDTNFMTVTANVRIIPDSLVKMADLYRNHAISLREASGD